MFVLIFARCVKIIIKNDKKNFLELKAVLRSKQHFLPQLIGQNVLIRSNSLTVVQYINIQGGLTLHISATRHGSYER